MFTEKAQKIVDRAKDHAFSSGSKELGVPALLAALIREQESAVLLCECLDTTHEALLEACPGVADADARRGKLPLAEPVRAILVRAKQFSETVPDQARPGLVNARHLVCATAVSAAACGELDLKPVTREAASDMLAAWRDRDAQSPAIDELTDRLRAMRSELLEKVYGQDHAVHAFVAGMFNSEVVAAADTRRRAPRAVFVFAGPAGVGKTYLAELGAAALERPFKRFDMSAYSGLQQNESLVGMAKSFRGAHPGTLTEFVEKNPDAVLLFDEVEKSHLNTIHLFLQILDAGTLEDKYHEREVRFRDTTIIFTTNAGRRLYEQPNTSGVHSANEAFHRRTILDALENEKDPQTGEPFFPAPICSRLATGYPVLFNHLRVNELEAVVRAELARIAGLLERQYYKRVSFHDLLSICLVLREGARADARTLRSQAEIFVKTELFKFCQLFKTERLEDVFKGVDRIGFELGEKPDEMDPRVRDLLVKKERPRVLLAADPGLAALYRKHVDAVEWRAAADPDDALRIMTDEEVDLVLVDLWIGKPSASLTSTTRHFDHVPAAAKALGAGQELLRRIRDRLPEMPVYLLSLHRSADEPERGSVDRELFLACVQGGGARGMISSFFTGAEGKGWERRRDLFAGRLRRTCEKVHREGAAAKLANERKVLMFDTAPRINDDSREIAIRLRNLRVARAIASADTGELLENVERPRTRFEDVVGADAAKDELRFFIDFLKSPRRFAARGLKPPKGVLLVGPPGTGKTMLARAMAGESDVAYLPANASSFVTVWQGSGPQNIRDLFERARRYAPAIIFIDEIDAIGRVRTGGAGGEHASENTLNALLAEMDGFTSPSADRPIFLLAATNFSLAPEDGGEAETRGRLLDPALVRRFSRTITVDLPERAARERYLTRRLASRRACAVSEEAVKLIAERSAGMSIANLESIIETAARAAAKEEKDLDDRRLEEAFETVRYGEARGKGPDEMRRTAVHEAGHTLLYWLSGWCPSYVTVVSRGGHGGYMAPCSEDAERTSFTKAELLAKILVALGGRAAETLVYQDGSGLATGASSDLDHASSIARRMLCQYGMDEEFGILAAPELISRERGVGGAAYTRLNEAANRILSEQLLLARKLLTENRKRLDALADALAESERLSAEDLKRLLPKESRNTVVSLTGLMASSD